MPALIACEDAPDCDAQSDVHYVVSQSTAVRVTCAVAGKQAQAAGFAGIGGCHARVY